MSEEDCSLAEAKMPMLSNDREAVASDYKDDDLSPKGKKKGGYITLPFIILNESFEKVASYGLLPNMIFYLMKGYHMDAAKGTIVLSLWGAASNAMAIFGAFLSDSYLGRFRVIAIGTFASLLGTVLLWLTTMVPAMKPPPCPMTGVGCESATGLQYLLLFTSFALISVGAGCVRPCSLAFGADQISNKDNPDNERVLDSFFNWYYASTGLSTIIALTLIVYIQDHLGWKIGFGLPSILMVLSLGAFLFGSYLYVHVKPTESLFKSLLQVPVAAFKKRNVSLPPPDAEECYFYETGSNVTTPSDNLRCLNRACVIEDAEREVRLGGSATSNWSLCPVDRVETVKAIVRIMPMWTTGIMMVVALNNSYTTLQSSTMNRHLGKFEIPAGSFSIFSIVTITIWVAFYDRALVPVLRKYFGMPRGLGPKVRMGLGLLISSVGLVVGAIVESVRRKRAYDEGIADQPGTIVGMSAMWLVPQLVLVGLAEGLNAVGQIEFYYTHLSKNMSSLAMAIFTLGMAVASLVGSLLVELVDKITSRGGRVSWLDSNLNKGHVDYYYWLVAFLCLINFLYFLICCRLFGETGEHHGSKHVLTEDKDSRGLHSA